MSEFTKGTNKFVDWVHRNFQQVSSKLKVVDLRSESQGRGLVAEDDITEGETLFEFTRDKIINVDSATLTNLRDGQNETILISLGQWEALILCLAYEIMLGDKSRWHPYLQILPQNKSQFSTLMYWKEDELKYLKPSSVLDRIGKESVIQLYHKLVPRYCTKLGVPKMAEFLTLEKFSAIGSLIMSYSFDVDHAEVIEEEEEEEDKEEKNAFSIDKTNVDGIENEQNDNGCSENDNCSDNKKEDIDEDDLTECIRNDTYLKSMVPLADTLNANTTLVNATLHYDHEKLAMKAIKDIKKGEQIYNTYGELPNSEILRKYGYIELPSSAAEFADLPLCLIIDHYKKCFTKAFPTLKNAPMVVNRILDLIKSSEYLEQTLVDSDGGIVIDKYEIYAKGELLPEFILMLLIFSTLLGSFKSDLKWFKRLLRHSERREFDIFVNRTVVKCFQLLEERSIVTKSLMQDLKDIVISAIDRYPEKIREGKYELPNSFSSKLSKQDIADIILSDEVACLKSTLDGEFPPKSKETGTPKYTIIEDKKLLRNVLKRKIQEDERRLHKRKRA
mgnify:FL=1